MKEEIESHNRSTGIDMEGEEEQVYRDYEELKNRIEWDRVYEEYQMGLD